MLWKVEVQRGRIRKREEVANGVTDAAVKVARAAIQAGDRILESLAVLDHTQDHKNPIIQQYDCAEWEPS